MRVKRGFLSLFLCCMLWMSGEPASFAQDRPPLLPPQTQAPPARTEPVANDKTSIPPFAHRGFNPAGLPAATPACDKPLPINLASALRLANAQSLDIAIADREVQAAAARLRGARALWIPSVYSGVDYLHHEGPIQANDGSVSTSSRGSMELGAAPYAVFALTEAIFQPLAARQVMQQREAELQATTNDTVLFVAQVYFDAVQARAELSATEEVYRQTRDLVRKTESLAPGIVPSVEVSRTRTQLARNEQAIEQALQRWRVASAEVVRVIRLDPTTLIEPMEPPQLRVDLIDPHLSLPDLLTVAWTSRPELAASQALVRASLDRLRQEQWRPFLPIIMLRGAGTQTPYPMAVGAFGGGSGSNLSNFNVRGDFDVQALWELRNLGLGNRALIRENRALNEQAELRVERIKDYISREVAQASAILQSAAARISQAERELSEAKATARDSLIGLGETKRVGGSIIILVIRPQEAVAAIQSLLQAYTSAFGAVADYNRAQFALYRALGNPAQLLDELGPKHPEACCSAPQGSTTACTPK